MTVNYSHTMQIIATGSCSCGSEMRDVNSGAVNNIVIKSLFRGENIAEGWLSCYETIFSNQNI